MVVAQGYGIRWITRNTIRLKYMLPTSIRVRKEIRPDLVGEKIKAIGRNDFLHLATDQCAELYQITVDLVFYRQDQGSSVGSPLGQCKRCGGDIHLAITNKNVTITPKTTETFVLVNIGIVRVEKAAVTNNQIEYRVTVAVRLGRIAAEYVIDLPSVVLSTWHLAVAVIAGVPPWIGQPLELVSFGMPHEPKVRIRIAAR